MTKNFENKNEVVINGLGLLAQYILSFPESLKDKMTEAFYKNQWFTLANQELMLQSIAKNYLDRLKLSEWISNYKIKNHEPKKIGIVMAGNIPLVGFHDLLCVWLSGNIALVKLSSKDEALLPFLVKQLEILSPEFKGKTIFSDRLNDADAIIATGSNNSARYFEYYFKKNPHIIRNNRSSVAFLTGDESGDIILELGKDIFRYFGLGCRNVSKLFLPVGYDPKKIFEGLSIYSEINQHNKYKNNFDYNLTILLMNKTPHLHNEFFILQENQKTVSPIATIYYEFYTPENDLKEKLSVNEKDIQCIVGKNYIPFGKAQEPSLSDYADQIDVLNFLSGINENG
ncbi:MAG: acyl-CoA reductase [Bacteroidota bacterium]